MACRFTGHVDTKHSTKFIVVVDVDGTTVLLATRVVLDVIVLQ